MYNENTIVPLCAKRTEMQEKRMAQTR